MKEKNHLKNQIDLKTKVQKNISKEETVEIHKIKKVVL